MKIKIKSKKTPEQIGQGKQDDDDYKHIAVIESNKGTVVNAPKSSESYYHQDVKSMRKVKGAVTSKKSEEEKENKEHVLSRSTSLSLSSSLPPLPCQPSSRKNQTIMDTIDCQSATAGKRRRVNNGGGMGSEANGNSAISNVSERGNDFSHMWESHCTQWSLPTQSHNLTKLNANVDHIDVNKDYEIPLINEHVSERANRVVKTRGIQNECENDEVERLPEFNHYIRNNDAERRKIAGSKESCYDSNDQFSINDHPGSRPSSHGYRGKTTLYEQSYMRDYEGENAVDESIDGIKALDENYKKGDDDPSSSVVSTSSYSNDEGGYSSIDGAPKSNCRRLASQVVHQGEHHHQHHQQHRLIGELHDVLFQSKASQDHTQLELEYGRLAFLKLELGRIMRMQKHDASKMIPLVMNLPSPPIRTSSSSSSAVTKRDIDTAVTLVTAASTTENSTPDLSSLLKASSKTPGANTMVGPGTTGAADASHAWMTPSLHVDGNNELKSIKTYNGEKDIKAMNHQTPSEEDVAYVDIAFQRTLAESQLKSRIHGLDPMSNKHSGRRSQMGFTMSPHAFRWVEAESCPPNNDNDGRDSLSPQREEMQSKYHREDDDSCDSSNSKRYAKVSCNSYRERERSGYRHMQDKSNRKAKHAKHEPGRKHKCCSKYLSDDEYLDHENSDLQTYSKYDVLQKRKKKRKRRRVETLWRVIHEESEEEGNSLDDLSYDCFEPRKKASGYPSSKRQGREKTFDDDVHYNAAASSSMRSEPSRNHRKSSHDRKPRRVIHSRDRDYSSESSNDESSENGRQIPLKSHSSSHCSSFYNHAKARERIDSESSHYSEGAMKTHFIGGPCRHKLNAKEKDFNDIKRCRSKSDTAFTDPQFQRQVECHRNQSRSKGRSFVKNQSSILESLS